MTTPVANTAPVLPPLQFVADGTAVPPIATTNNTTNNNTTNATTKNITNGHYRHTTYGPFHCSAPRPPRDPEYRYALMAERYRRYDPLRDTLPSKDPHPKGFNSMQPPLERYIFFKKLTAHQQTTLIGQLTQDEQIELATARHLAMLETLLADATIRELSQGLASQPPAARDPELIEYLLDEIYEKLVVTSTISDEDFLTEEEEVQFLKDLHAFAPACLSQYWRQKGHSVNADEALGLDPDKAKTSPYTLRLENLDDPVKSRLTLSVGPKDAIRVAREISRLQNLTDSSMAQTSVMKIMGPRWQGRRYDSIVVYFTGLDPGGANTLAAKLRTALPNVNWLKIDSFMLDEISEGCGYGEHHEADTSLAEEHTKMFADTLLEIEGGSTLTHFQALRKNLLSHGRDLLNPALVRRDD